MTPKDRLLEAIAFTDAEFKPKIAELYSSLSDAKMALAEARESIRERDNEINRLTEVQATRIPTVRYKGYNFGVDEKGEPIGRPFSATSASKRQGCRFRFPIWGMVPSSIVRSARQRTLNRRLRCRENFG